MDLTVTDNLFEGRYEAVLDDQVVGTAEYELSDDLMILIHTDVEPTHQDQGIGGTLARFVVNDARRRGLRVRPVCPFLRSWLDRHPDYADLIG
jgi:predicted GNAT family acetyltransferase